MATVRHSVPDDDDSAAGGRRQKSARPGSSLKSSAASRGGDSGARPTRRSSAAAPTASPVFRIWLLAGLLLLWGFAVAGRLIVLQLFDYSWLAGKAERQQSRVIEVDAGRGAVFDRNMHPLAMSLAVDSIFAVPAQIANPHAAARRLAAVLGLDPIDLEGRLRANHGFCWVRRKVTPAQSQAVRALGLRGIYFEPESKRFYPKGELAAQVLGYVGVDGNGLGGVERQLDSEIRGHAGRILIQVDAHQRAYHRIERRPQPGENVVLTLDQNIQYIAQQELHTAMLATRSRRGTVIVENPWNGEILALANEPTFNPNDVAQAPATALADPAVQDVYEPGSVFKLVTLSAALQEKVLRLNEIIDCQMGSILVGGRLIHDHARFGLLTPTEILQHSSDVGAIKIGLRLGDDRFYKYIRAYGFGRQTGIELPGESRGIARPPQRWTKMSIGAVSMGQEIAVTPIQIAELVSTIAAGGVLHPPHVVMRELPGGAPPGLPAEGAAASPGDLASAPGRRVIGPEIANEMKLMMEQVVLGGSGRLAHLTGFTVAGKTGTAQKVDPGGRAYSAHDYVASFGGFAPLNNPAVVILVVLDSPVGLHEGGEVAAPVFKRIAERVLPYLGVPHDLPVDLPSLASARWNASDLTETSEEIGDPVVATADAGDSSRAGANQAPLLDPANDSNPVYPTQPAAVATALRAQPNAYRQAHNDSRTKFDLSRAALDASRAPFNSSSEIAAPSVARLKQRNAYRPALVSPGSLPAPPLAGTVVLDYGGSEAVPDLTGKSVREVSVICQRLGLDPMLIGDGVARAQNPPAGAHLQRGSRLVVQFGR
jgi:cell division protein FtsI (penicillin-binding protein 3)